MQDGGVIPDSGFPRDDGMAKEEHRKDDSITGGRHLRIIPLKRAFGAGRVS